MLPTFKSTQRVLTSESMQTLNAKPNGYLSSKEAAAYLNCSERHLFNLRNFYGKLKFYQFGRMVRFKQKDLDDFLEEYVMSPFDVKEGELTELPIAQIKRIY